ncbi:MAG: YcxB family protein [Cytophagales bacterium]|nr:YcxB family protein [Cytophaga sp.]
MEITIKRTPEDHLSFLTYVAFQRKKRFRLIIIILTSLWVSTSLKPAGIEEFLLYFAGITSCYFAIIIIAYVVSIVILKNKFKKKKELLEEVTIAISEEGIRSISESSDTLTKWETIKRIEDAPEWLYVGLGFRKSLIIPKRFFHSPDEANYFLESMQEKFFPKQAYFKSINGKHLYKWGLLGLIPNVGLLSGGILLYKGILTYKDKKLSFIGLGSIAFTFIFWFAAITISENSNSHKNSITEQTNKQLNELVKQLEFYNMQNNVYPDSLKQLANAEAWTYDPMTLSFNMKHPKELIYKTSRKKYELYSVGLDLIPGTKDDLYPTITKGDTIKYGFVRGL